MNNLRGKRYRIWSIEHGAWWRPNWKGYTEKLEDAGEYPYEEACEIIRSANINVRTTNVPNEAMIEI